MSRTDLTHQTMTLKNRCKEGINKKSNQAKEVSIRWKNNEKVCWIQTKNMTLFKNDANDDKNTKDTEKLEIK